MTIDEAIKTEESIAEENQRVVDTGIVFDDVTIDMLYCDDTEVIEEHLANYQECANEHRQLAEWLKDYKRLLEQQPCEDVISREAVIEWLKAKDIIKLSSQEETARKELKALPPVTPQQKYGKWIVHEKPHGIRYLECPYCNTWYLNEHLIRNSYCPNCGCRMVEPQERSDEE